MANNQNEANPMQRNLGIRTQNPHFECDLKQQQRNLEFIEELLQETNYYCLSIGLEIEKVIIKTNSDEPCQIPLKNRINIVDENIFSKYQNDQRLKEFAFKLLEAKDRCNMSDEGYKLIRKTLIELGIVIPTIELIREVRGKLDSTFSIRRNPKGFYFEPEEKLQFLCKRYLIDNNFELKNNSFLIKLAGDGSSLTKSGVTLLNFACTILNDSERAKSVKGNYSLGKLFFVSDI